MGVEGINNERARVTAAQHDAIKIAVQRQKLDVALALGAKLHELSPVNEGALRRGFHASNTRPTNQPQQVDDLNANIAQAVAGAAMEDPIYLQNYEPHALVYEDGTFTPPNPGPSKATHVPASRRASVEGRTLIVNGYHVVAPKGFTTDAIDQVASQFGLQRISSGT